MSKTSNMEIVDVDVKEIKDAHARGKPGQLRNIKWAKLMGTKIN